MGRKKCKKKRVDQQVDPHKSSSDRTYLKIEATFKSSNDQCCRRNPFWTSVHAWERDESIFCEFWETKAQLVKFLDETCEVDTYSCDCGTRWSSLHSGYPEECWKCWQPVAPGGTQNRFGRHFFFRCPNDACNVEWEDFSLNRQRTQNCSECGSKGHITQTQKVKPKPYWQLKKEAKVRKENGGEAGKHHSGSCDMCRDQSDQGIHMLCMNYRKIQCQVVEDSEDRCVEKITKTVI